MTDSDRPLLHICYAPVDRGWVLGRMVWELGLQAGQYLTREDDGMGESQLQAIADAVERCRFTVLVASGAARWDKLAQFAAGLAQHAGLEDQTPRLIVIARDIASVSGAGGPGLPLAQRALVGLDCSDEDCTVASLARLRALLALETPAEARPTCPYPGLAQFTVANRDLLFGRDQDRSNLVGRIRAGHSRLLIVGPSGSGKSSLIHAAVLPELSPADHVVQVVPRGDRLAGALREAVDALEVPGLGAALDAYAAARGASDAQRDEARARLRGVPVGDARRRIVVVDPLEEVFAEDDAGSREALFTMLSGLWSLPWCTVILCMRADFYGQLMALRCWRELESCQYPVAPLDEVGLQAAIITPAARAGVHVDAALVERLLREIDRDRASVPLPLLQVALKELWAHLRWRYLTLAEYERIVDRNQRGLAAALAVHADGVMQRLAAPGDRVVAQRILLDLVHLGEGRPHTRRRRALDDLRRAGDDPGQLERVLEQLIAGRLVTTGDGAADHEQARHRAPAGEASRFGRHVDLAHDTLITGWPELAGWIAERRNDLRTQRRLETRAATGELLKNPELPEFVRWVEATAAPAGQLLGVSDALRDLVRRSVTARRVRRAILGAMLAGAATFAVVFGLQVLRLREERAGNQQARDSAMEMSSMIVFDVDQELRKIAGASRLRECLLRRTREQVARLRMLGELQDGAQRIAMIGKQADAMFALERGHLDEALALYRDMLAEAQQRAAADPHNPKWQRDLSVIYNNLGEVAMRAGKVDAHAWFDKALAVREALVVEDPGNTERQSDLSTSYEKQGDIAVGAGQLDGAHAWFDKALAVRRRVAAAVPGNADWQRDLLAIYDKLGDIAQRTAKLDEARGWFDQVLVVARTLATADASNAEWQLDLSLAYERQGDVAASAGKLDEAGDWLDQALRINTRLATTDPSNTEWQHQLSRAYKQRGEIAMHASKFEEARGWFEQALAIRRELAAADPSNAGWQRDLAATYERRGEVALRAGMLEDARGWYEQAREVRRELAAAAPSNAECQRDLCAVLMMTAQLAQDPQARMTALYEARAIYARLQRDGGFRGDEEFARLGAGLEMLTGTCIVMR